VLTMTQPSHVESLISEHAPLVRKIAYKMVSRLPANIELDDLIQAGMMGLMEAARRYKEQVGAQFTTYATTCITGAINDELRRSDWLPRSVRDASKKIEKAIEELRIRNGRAPSENEIAQHLGLDSEEYAALLDKAQGVQIVFMGDGKDDEDTHQQSVESLPDDNDTPEELLQKVEFQKALSKYIDALPEREKLVLSLHYEQDLNYKEIAMVLDVSQGRVCQLRTQAIARIRSEMKKDGFL